MDSAGFRAPPTTTAGLKAYFLQNGATADITTIELVHFQPESDPQAWLDQWRETALPLAIAALEAGVQPVVGFSVYTWNAALFLDLAAQFKSLLSDLQIVAGGPHVQQARDYLGTDPIDVIFLGEAEITFQQFLDCLSPADWHAVDGLAFLDDHGKLVTTAPRARCQELDKFPSPLSVLQLTDAEGGPLYDAITYETSRGCPFKCAFCEWGTGAIGSRMYQWSLPRITADWETIAAAGIRNIWLADSNFGALKQDLDKARALVELKERTGLPQSFATSWSKKHSRQVQQIALLLHQHKLLPHYQLALQTLTPEALRLSNRQNMSSNEYQPIARHMSEQGVPIAAELIWGLPGDNLPEFEHNLDQLLATFPNINIFGYTLLPGTEFYRRREEYRIEAIPVAGYGKAKGEYVVGCHTFTRDQGEEGYFLITAHILLVHGHIMPLTTRLLALGGVVPVSPLLRDVLRDIITQLASKLQHLDLSQRMTIYEQRNALYLQVLEQRDALYRTIGAVIERHCRARSEDPRSALQVLQLDRALCPRRGAEHRLVVNFDFNAQAVYDALAAMTLPDTDRCACTLEIEHPGGVGDILHDADGGSWLRGVIDRHSINASDVEYVAIA